jgi:chromosome segregation ATPase
MAFRITSIERGRLNAFSVQLSKEHTDLSGTVDEQLEIINTAVEKINGAIDTYNEALNSARGYVEDIQSQAQSDYDDKSERWQESERGGAVQEWISTLENLVAEMEDVEQLALDLPDNNYTDHSEFFDTIEDEPSY